MAEARDEPPESKLTRTNQRWAREGRFLTGKTSRPRSSAVMILLERNARSNQGDSPCRPNAFNSRVGALDTEQRKKLMEMADKCPVHRTLTSEIHIVTRPAD